ncbi:MAG: hypothetical protein J07HB67_02654 [halophilic archaeon J07HB67]|nr:MAG: hypothetical protein J07HB67_02654 [halophilic archaeon J07HB67]
MVRGGLTHDRETGVSVLLGTSPLSTGAYLLGKFLSALAALGVVTGVLAAATTAAFLLNGTGPFDPVGLWGPFLLLTGPAITITAAAAVSTETVGPLRGTLGSAVYVFGALVLVALGVQGTLPFDPTGLSLLQRSTAADVAAQFGTAEATGGFAYVPAGSEATTFRWSGIEWTPPRLVDRAAAVGVAAVLLSGAAASFDRFDPDAGADLPSIGTTGAPTATREPSDTASVDELVSRLSPAEAGGFRVLSATAAELRVALRRRRLWYLAVGGVVVGSLVAPLGVTRSALVPVGVLSTLPALSALGTRERRHHTASLLFTTASPVRLLVPTYLSGVAVVGLVVGPAGVRFTLLGQTGVVVGLVGAALALPAAALAVGVWTTRPRVFETAFLLAWYLGPVNGVAPLDFVAANPETVAAGVPLAYLAATPLSLAVAALGRRR